MAKKVAVAMSGGVDSSGAALLLKKLGYDVSGVTLLMRDGGETEAKAAQANAAAIGIPHTILDQRALFQRAVIQHFTDEYAAGRTPNPCVDCNRCLKFGALMDWALDQGADFLATGHYAQVAFDGRWQLLRGQDRSKDQSYVLYQLTQRQLSHLLLPVGDYRKETLRELAQEAGLPSAHRKDSQDICFIPDGDYGAFLERQGLRMEPGNFVDEQGTVLGRHRGQARYTIGQRKGLGVSAGHPVYVLRKDVEHNRVVLGSNEDLFTDTLIAQNMNWISIPALTEPLTVTAKTRYSQREAEAVVQPLEGDRVLVTFREPQRAVTAGQAVVFYQGERVVGGGTIWDNRP